MAQKCRPQYFLPRAGYSCCNRREVRPFILLTKSDSDFDGPYSMCMWTWSLLTTPLRIRTSSASHICNSKSRQRTLMSPCSTGYRYFVTHTKCAVSRVIVCPLCRSSRIGHDFYHALTCVATESLALKCIVSTSVLEQ